ncbi:hypothetical protein ACLKA6_017316 [Drosophila palustris]
MPPCGNNNNNKSSLRRSTTPDPASMRRSTSAANWQQQNDDDDDDDNISPTSYRMLEQVGAPAVAADRGRTFMATPECNPAFNTASHLQHHHHQRWQRYAASGHQLVFIQLPECHHGWQLASTAARESSTDAAIPPQSTCNINRPFLRHWALL